MKYFSGGGDGGRTTIASGRVAKDSPIIDAIGEIDELGAFVGNALSKAKFDHRITADLRDVERCLYLINSELSGYLSKTKGGKVKVFSDMEVRKLEKAMKFYSKRIEYVPKFVYPNGTEFATAINICRVVTRRVERAVTGANIKDGSVGAYINRLSSFFYVLFRFANKLEKYKEEFF